MALYVVLSHNNSFIHFSGTRSVHESLAFLEKHSGVYYIHNINFDGCLIIHALSEMNKTFTLLMNGMNIYSIKIDKIEFRCSYKLLPQPLHIIGSDLVGLGKLPFPYKKYDGREVTSQINSSLFNSDDEYRKYCLIVGSETWNDSYIGVYCERDVDITLRFVKIYWKTMSILSIKWPNKHYSASSISVWLFYSKYNTFKIPKYGCGRFEEYIRESYYGGRCEVFGNPYLNDIIHHYDYSGMYAQCMHEKYPYGDPYFCDTCKNVDIPGFYRIRWYSEHKYPILPMHIEGKLMFCSGYGSGTYWYEEIKLFLENGGKILEICSGVLYHATDYVLDDFISSLEKIRNLGGEYKTIGKLLINSFYGRMGMSEKSESWKVVPKNDNIEYIKKIDIGNVFIVCEYLELQHKTIGNISIATITTSKARIKLYRGFLSVMKYGGRLLYCDTDSIFVSFAKKMLNIKMGDVIFTIENKAILKDCVFALPKSYSILDNTGWTTKIKGFSRNVISFNEFKTNFYSNKDITTLERSILRKNFILKNHIYNKILNISMYKKRSFNIDKNETVPIFKNI